MKHGTARTYGIAIVLLGISVHTTNSAEATGAPTCTLALTVQLTPDVPNPSNAGFLSSLLGNNVGYRLTLMRLIDDTTIDVRLDGPGPLERCQEVVDSMRDDSRVMSIDLQDDS